MADAVNFHRGVTNSKVENSFVRGTGDDGLAMWSHHDENRGNIFRANTVIAPTLANGIAIYGGRVGALWFYALDHPITGAAIEVSGLRLIDSSYEAIQFIGEKPISGVTMSDIHITGAGTAAFQLQAPGSASIERVNAQALGSAAVLADDEGFRLIDRGGNRGIDTTAPFP